MDVSTFQLLFLPMVMMAIGIVLLVKGGDWTIDSAVFIAKRYGLSPMIVGFTILAFGTSLPELIISILSVLRGSEGIAMGNVIGSNIANILLVIGVAAIFATLTTQLSKGLLKDMVMMLVCSFIMLGLMLYGDISRVAGAVMIAFLLGYVFLQYRMALRGELEPEMPDDEDDVDYTRPLFAYGFLALGLIAIAGGAEFLVRGAKESASILGVPEAVIALSIIAFGTSLPELSTSIIAARKGHTDMLLGNIIGSNVFNILMIIGVTALVKPIVQSSYAAQLLDFDIWVMLAVAIIFAGLVFGFKKITKPIGIVFVSVYILYNIYIYAIYLQA